MFTIDVVKFAPIAQSAVLRLPTADFSANSIMKKCAVF